MKAAIVIAMESEAAPLKAALKDAECFSLCGFKGFKGSADGGEIAAIISGEGKVNAALAAMAIINFIVIMILVGVVWLVGNRHIYYAVD